MPNALSQEKSPYLQQHQNNPVHWYPWGSEAIEMAKRENKPIFLSIGYSTCHWCHVMEKESFEDQTVADALNEHFVNIKVDREERPDIDSIYMDAVQAFTGHGGWPLSVWLTPELKPFFGGMYFPKPVFLEILTKVKHLWEKHPESLFETSEKVFQGLSTYYESVVQKRSSSSSSSLGEWNQEYLKKLLIQFTTEFSSRFDPVWGGYHGAPKFPPCTALRVLLRNLLSVQSDTTQNVLRQQVSLTLDRILMGGIRDHLAGGFHRYSVDERWEVPHFEKMLYDQAQLAMVYTEAFQVFQSPHYAHAVRETLDFVLESLTDPEGGFYCGYDADSFSPEIGSKEEGYYYTFTSVELQKCLTHQEWEMFQAIYAFPEEGHLEGGGRCVLTLRSVEDLTLSLEPGFLAMKKKILGFRNTRAAPACDDKVLMAWSGLMIQALAKAGFVLKEKRYIQAAQKASQFIFQNMVQGSTAWRRWRQGELKVPAQASDLASMIEGLFELYRADSNPKWVQEAQRLEAMLEKRFYSGQGSYFESPEGDVYLIARKVEDQDGVVPCASSMVFASLLRLFLITQNQKNLDRAQQMFQVFEDRFRQAPLSHSYFFCGLWEWLAEPVTLVAVGRKEKEQNEVHAAETLAFLRNGFYPNTFLVLADAFTDLPIVQGKKPQGSDLTYYCCDSQGCRAPVTNPQKLQEIFSQIARKRVFL